MLANGATLGYKEKEGSSATYTDLPGLKEIPDCGVEPEKVENTCLTDKNKQYENGIGDLGVTAQEALAELHVPYQLIGVHVLAAVAAAACLMYARCEAHVPLCLQGEVGSVGKIPRVAVSCTAEHVSRMIVVHRTVKLYLKPVFVVSEGKIFAIGRRARYVLLRV